MLTSSCLAETYIQRAEEKEVYKMLYPSLLLYKRIDDAFARTSHNLIETYGNKIEFIMEKQKMKS